MLLGHAPSFCASLFYQGLTMACSLCRCWTPTLLYLHQVGLHYDGLISKIITWGSDRDQALAALLRALAQTQVLMEAPFFYHAYSVFVCIYETAVKRPALSWS
jgi:hypothetical protein